MNYQSEQTLENNLIEQLKKSGYSYVTIKDEKEMLLNFKKQLELHNDMTFSDREFEKILNHLNK
jgi:type I restriction enzyme R subunit